MDNDAKEPGPVTETPHAKMREQARALDDALLTIHGFTAESRQARTYLIAQIEALNWAADLFSVG
jgi:hypothetical protein